MTSPDLTTATTQAAQQKRNKAIKLSIIVSICSKTAGVIIQFLALPVALHALGKDKYGVFITVMTLVTMVQTANLGVGPGVSRALTHYAADPDHDEERSWFQAARWLVLAFCALILVLGLGFPHLVPLTKVYGSTFEPLAGLLDQTFFWAVLVATLISFLSLADATYSGYLEDYWPRVFHAIGYAMSIGTILFVAFYVKNPAFLLLAIFGTPCLPRLYGMWRLRRVRPYLWEGGHKIDWSKFRYLVKTNLGSTSIQLGDLLVISLGTVVVSNTLGVTEAVKFGSLFMWYQMVITLRAMVLDPMQSSLSNAWAKRDLPWLRRALKKAFLLVGAVGVGASLFFGLLGSPLSHLLFTKDTAVSPAVCLGLGFMILSNFVMGTMGSLVMAFDKYSVAGGMAVVRGVVTLTIVVLTIKQIGIGGYYWVAGVGMLLMGLGLAWTMHEPLREIFFGKVEPKVETE